MIKITEIRVVSFCVAKCCGYYVVLFFLFRQLIVNTYEDLMKNVSVSWGLALVSSFEKMSSLGSAIA